MANRKRGAQPGNLNALKHGFYSRSFLDLENTDLEAMLAQDLESEIAMLRVVVRRAFELSTAPDRSQSPLEGAPPQSPLEGAPPQSPLEGAPPQSPLEGDPPQSPLKGGKEAGQELDAQAKLGTAIHVMNSLGMASIRLGSLLKIQAMLGKREGDIGATISEALKEVARELKL
jgi:hypothetical protein